MTEDPPLPGWFLTRCPACGAGRQEPCVTIAPPAEPREEPHAARLDRARRLERLGLKVVGSMSLDLGRYDIDAIRKAAEETDDPWELEILQAALGAEEEQLAQDYARLALDHEADWRRWLPYLFPTSFKFPFADHHATFWDYVWAIDAGVQPRPSALLAVWARGGAKSTSTEAAVAALGARRRRKVALYVCDKQQQADDHVASIGTLLESRRVALAYPQLGSRLVGKFGSSEGWRRNRLRTASGFTVNALGLDVAARGIKIDDDRPDLIVFDDLDDERDGPELTNKKIERITLKLLPAGDAHTIAVIGVQNIPNPQGVFARLVGLSDEPADFLRDRITIGPIPAIADATFEHDAAEGWQVIAGTPTWAGQDLEIANRQIGLWGYTAFRREAQHDTSAVEGGMFGNVRFTHRTRAEVPDLLRKVCWVDPAITETDHSDAHGCVVDGSSPDGTIYRLRAWERRASPAEALRLACAWAAIEGCPYIGVETDQGGDTWNSVFREARDTLTEDLDRARTGEPITGGPEYLAAVAELSGLNPRDHPIPEWLHQEKASRTQLSKASRAQQMLADYEAAGRIVHVLGDHLLLERALLRFGKLKPFDLVDAAYWSWRDLRLIGPSEALVPQGSINASITIAR